MAPNESNVSVAIETSCRYGGVALGVDGQLVAGIRFDASSRHATVLVKQLHELLGAAGLAAGDIDEVYVSAGPGSFTGLRVGITVARTLGQTVSSLRCVSVPTDLAVADGVRQLAWEHLAVVMDARDELIYAAMFARRGRQIVRAGQPGVMRRQGFLAAAPEGLVIVGEGAAYHELAAPGVGVIPPDEVELHFPTAQGVWRVGRRLAQEGQFTEYHQLLPIYLRPPEAVRLWEERHGPPPRG